MGWKAGEGLGAGVSGRAAPIEVTLKASRKGLGVEEADRRRRAEVAAEQQERGVLFAEFTFFELQLS